MKQILFAILAVLLLASPAVLSAKKKTVTVTYQVNMHCKNCVAKITDNISFLKGVEDLKVSLPDKTVTVTYDPAKTDEASLQKAIEKLGYSAEKVKPDAKASPAAGTV